MKALRSFWAVTACAALCVAALVCVFALQPFGTLSASAETLPLAAARADNELADTYQSESKLINEPTVILDVTDKAALDSIVTEGKRPSNVILRLDQSMNVVASDGTELGTFVSVYTSLNKKIIPVVDVKSEAEADAFINFLTEQINILDIGVISDNPEMIKRVKTAFPHVRGIARDCDAATANKNFAQTVVLNQSKATRDAVEHLQARFKAVWVYADSTETTTFYGCVNSGAYGIITTDFAAAYAALETYEEGYTRPMFAVAHRGLPSKYNENSLSGTRASIENGASHVELDGKITKDGVIMMMHDDSVARTATGTGNIENMTYEEARKLRLDLFAPKDEPIPTLDEIMEEFKGTKSVLVFEIKTSKAEIIPALREAIERNDFWDQMVAIAFDTEQLVRMKEQIPEIPTANLNDVTAANFAACLKWMGELNTGVDSSKHDSTLNEKYLRDRGIIGWYWTFDKYEDVMQARKKGYVGITTNNIDSIGEHVRRVDGDDIFDVPKSRTYAVGNNILLKVSLYNGTTTDEFGYIYNIHDYGKYYGIIAEYTAEDGTTHYTNLIYAHKQAEGIPVYVWIIIGVGGALIIGGAVVLILRKCRNKKLG